MTESTLYYIADPMCSWCYGFHPVLDEVRRALPSGVGLQLVLGGLAPDSDEPMPEDLRTYVRNAWKAVEERTGRPFNLEFWDHCEPRRSTYPACRAVIAAGLQRDDARLAMFEAIQRAYYREARNPSDLATLDALATELEPTLDAARFASDLRSDDVERRLQADLALAWKFGIRGFPSLVLEANRTTTLITNGYSSAAEILARLAPIVGSGSDRR